MRRIIASLLVLLATVQLLADEPDLVIADFEATTYGDWKVTGEAFGPGPARGTLPNQMNVEGFEGKGLVNSFFKGDSTTGTLTSPEVTIERKYLSFLIGGGKHDNKTCINLLVDGKIVRTASGPNDQPGGAERLEWSDWDVSDLKGKKATIQIVDMVTGGWGHINVDHILQTNTRRGAFLATRELQVDGDYLLLPVKNGSPKRRLKLLVDGKIVRDFEIELAIDQAADFVVAADVRAFRGKTLTVETMLRQESKALEAIKTSDSPPADSQESNRRPVFHFTSHRGWLNDPNGLVYSQGEWHLFYQHNPYGWNWGNMHWGHAISKDLLHWKEQPTALYPREWGDWAFSGSAVVDAKNTSGFKTGSDDVLVAAYTSTGRGECIVYSNDRGKTWKEFEGNPVVKHSGRDPKLIWHEPTSRWVMAVYDEPSGQRDIAFYTSPDLKAWTFTSRIKGFYECPDLFPLAIDGKSAQQLWVLYAADGKYMLGDFDGQAFHPKTDKMQVWHGNFYAAQTFSDAPDGRRVQIGWANGITFPGQPFNQQMTIPVELTLRTTPAGPRLFAWPVKEVDAQSDGHSLATILTIDRLDVPPGAAKNILAGGAKLDLFDFQCEWELQQADRITITFCGTPVTIDAKAKKLTCQNVTVSIEPKDGRLPLRVIGDRGSLEIFVNQGESAISVGYQPSQTDKDLKVSAEGGDAILHRPDVADLRDR